MRGNSGDRIQSFGGEEMSNGEVYDEDAQMAVEAVCKERDELKARVAELERRNAACSPKPLAWEYERGGKSATLPNGVARLFIEKEGDPPHYFFGIEIEGEKIPLEFGFLEEEDAKKEAQMWLDNFARSIARVSPVAFTREEIKRIRFLLAECYPRRKKLSAIDQSIVDKCDAILKGFPE